MCLDILATLPHISSSLRLFGSKFAGVPGVSLLKAKAALLLFPSLVCGACWTRLHLRTVLDSVHSRWLVDKEPTPIAFPQDWKGLCFREKVGILVPTLSMALQGWLPLGWEPFP